MGHLFALQLFTYHHCYLCVFVCLYTRSWVCVCVHMRAYVSGCVWMCASVCLCMCVCVQVKRQFQSFSYLLLPFCGFRVSFTAQGSRFVWPKPFLTELSWAPKLLSKPVVPRTPYSAPLKMPFGCCQRCWSNGTIKQAAESKRLLCWDPQCLSCLCRYFNNKHILCPYHRLLGGRKFYIFILQIEKLQQPGKRWKCNQTHPDQLNPWIWALPITLEAESKPRKRLEAAM